MSIKMHLVPQNIQDVVNSILSIINSGNIGRDQNFINSKVEQIEETKKFCEKFLDYYYKNKK